MKLYSKINPFILCHKIHRISEDTEGRVDITDPKEFLQISSLVLNEGKTFRPHKHILQERNINITQESWVVIKGSVKAILYDLDDSILAEVILNAGDMSVTFCGGHNYVILEDDSRILEFKNGPYNGQAADKVFID